ncbi:hypothetical protein BX616_005308 [Lobosporangium transversale]|nr:hypothetical protein BX616_005308 [Lobosporangium transversale]
MCGFNYVLKKRARFYELISYRGVRIAITVLFVLVMLFPSGYVMKMCVLLSGNQDTLGATPTTYFQTLRDISSSMSEMSVFPICKVTSDKLSFHRPSPSLTDAVITTKTKAGSKRKANSTPTKADSTIMSSSSHFISLFPGPYAPHISNSNMHTTYQQSKIVSQGSSSTTAFINSGSKEETNKQRGSNNNSSDSRHSPLQGSWAKIAACIDIMGSSQFASMLLHSFTNDRIMHFLLCRLQHLHLGFFLLGSASNVYMACKMLSDMYDLIITPPHSRFIKNFFLVQASIFVIWFWFSYNLMAFRASATEEEFMSELPLWALRWINVGVAIVDLSYRRIYNRLGKLKVEEELLDISDVEKVEKMQQKAWLHQQQRFLHFGQEQGQYLLDQFMALEVKQSILNGANAAVDVVSDVYSKTNISSFSPIPQSLALAVNMVTTAGSSISINSTNGSCASSEEEPYVQSAEIGLHETIQGE